MIDELDRLFPDEVVTVFQMIKSNLDLPCLFFVVAMDGKVMLDALKTKGVSKPDYYLQKIFQRSCLINTKYQIKTLSENFIMKYLDQDKKSHRELQEALLAYFYLEDHVFIFVSRKSASFYDILLSNDYTHSIDALDSTYVSSRVPKRFTDLVKCFFDDAKIIEEFYKMYRISTYWLTAYDSEDLLDIGLDSFKQMIRALKRNRVHKNPFAYYYGVLKRKLDELYYG